MKISLRQFLTWNVLSAITALTIIHYLLNQITLWYYFDYPIVDFKLETFCIIGANFINVLLMACVAFYVVQWLNFSIPWSLKKGGLRVVVEVIIFTLISNFWLFILNESYLYVKTGFFLKGKDIVYLCVSGTIINFFILTLVEVFLLLNLRHHIEMTSKKLQLENSKYKYELLKNQLNPHFLFNSLSVLNSLITIDADSAKRFVGGFSNVLRGVLDFRFRDSISLSEEKVFLDQYIYLLKTRFAGTLTIEVIFPDAFLNKKILPMVLQLLIENVIKHNEISDNRPMLIKVKAQDNGITVSNNIQLKSSRSSWGIGLNYIKSHYASTGRDIDIIESNKKFSVFIPYL